ncbi:MAG TPA: Uma2 family endonuclease [Gemmatimonadales bacterium]|nr:Uma2 family endonuclease [Gemmatimonadales bacterium]
MGMADLAPKWTRQMVQALPDDGNCYELFGGELLVTPAPSGSAFPDPTLVIEVLSPSTAHFDRFTKRRRFQRAGIPEYWIVDLDARAVDRWRPAGELIAVCPSFRTQ